GEVERGLPPQLALEAAMPQAGASDGVPPGPVGALPYWQLLGGDPAGRLDRLKVDGAADSASAGLARLIAAFDDENTPYLSQPNPDGAPRHSDYDHLARVKEWSVGGSGGAA